MPVKLGKEGTMGCDGDKPWPLIEVATGKQVACGGPTRADALKALQARNMASAGIPMRKGKMYVTSAGIKLGT